MGDLVRQHEERIKQLHKEHRDLFQKTAMAIFEIGGLLTEVRETLDQGDWLPWVRDRLPFSDRTAQRYLRMYEHFKNVDRKQIAEMAATEAYVAAGIRKMIAATPKEPDKKRVVDPFAEIRAMKLKGKSLSGLKLKNTRMAWDKDELFVERTHIGMGRKVSLCISPHVDQDPAIFEELKDNIRIAIETYYFKVEQEESSGRIVYPQSNYREIIKHKKSKDNAGYLDIIDTKAAKAAGGKKC